MVRLEAIERLQHNTRRVVEIVSVLVKYGLADWLRAVPLGFVQTWLQSAEGEKISDVSFERRVRLAMSELGTTFIKLGQMLGTRPDLISPELAEELSHLHTTGPADPIEMVRQTIRDELGNWPAELFAQFDPEPFACGSIAQVHGARLKSGEDVVVKIQKVGIRQRIEADLSILGGLAELAVKYAPQLKSYDPVGVIRQFRRTILRELDFACERRSLIEFAKNFEDDATVRFPKPHREYSLRRVLTMERLRGVSGADVDALHHTHADLNEFARRGAAMYLEMIFRDSFYHADPHPGNLLLLDGGVVGVLDCGMVGRLDETLHEQIESMLLAVAHADARSLTDAVWNLSSVPPKCSREQLESDLMEFVADYAGRAIVELDLASALNDLAGIIRRSHIVLPHGLALLLKMLVLLEGTSQRLSPDFSLAEIIEPHVTQSVGRRLSPRRIAKRMGRMVREWDRVLEALPRDLSEALRRMRSGQFRVHLDHHHLDPTVNRLVLGILAASLFLGSSLLWSMKAAPLLFGVSVFGALGYAVAIRLGWRVLRGIKKSGDVAAKE